jgi:hypothetical protein
LCSKSIIDSETNNVSIFNVIEQLNIEALAEKEDEKDQKKILPIKCELVSLWIRENIDKPTKGKMEIDLLAPNGERIKGSVTDLDLSEYPRSRVRTDISGIPIKEGGYYWLVVLLQNEGETEWREVARLPIEVRLELVRSN